MIILILNLYMHKLLGLKSCLDVCDLNSTGLRLREFIGCSSARKDLDIAGYNQIEQPLEQMIMLVNLLVPIS